MGRCHMPAWAEPYAICAYGHMPICVYRIVSAWLRPIQNLGGILTISYHTIPYGNAIICPYAICPYDHMPIWPYGHMSI